VRNEPNSGRGCGYWRDRICQTNPIRTSGEESVGQAGTPNAVRRVWEPDPPYTWAQLRQTNPIQPGRQVGRSPWEGETCETKPISQGRLRETNPISRPRPPTGKLCRTNPIRGDAAWGEATGAWDARQSCETNPIWRRNVRNKPNSAAAAGRGKYLVEKDLWRIEHAEGLRKTKPISARRFCPPAVAYVPVRPRGYCLMRLSAGGLHTDPD